MSRVTSLFVAILAVLAAVSAASAQHRDYFTPEEIEIVRDAQEIDDRINVLVYAADRRFAAIGMEVQMPKVKRSDSEWGKAPAGTRAELLDDIRRILQKAVDDLDNIAERPEAAILPHPDDPKSKKPKTITELFPIAVRSLAAGAERFRPALAKELESSADRTERALISTLIDLSDQIIEAATRIPKLPAKSKKSE
jgi:hypothetical protein